MSEKLTPTIKGSVGEERVTFTSVARDRHSQGGGSSEISVAQERLPDGRQAVGVQGYTVKGIRTPAGEDIVTVPKSVLLEAAARIVAQDIVRFTTTASDIVTFARNTASRIRGVRNRKTGK